MKYAPDVKTDVALIRSISGIRDMRSPKPHRYTFHMGRARRLGFPTERAAQLRLNWLNFRAPEEYREAVADRLERGG